MTEVNTHQRPGEFIALAAFLMATIAFAIDMMLPAMGPMAVDLKLRTTPDLLGDSRYIRRVDLWAARF